MSELEKYSIGVMELTEASEPVFVLGSVRDHNGRLIPEVKEDLTGLWQRFQGENGALNRGQEIGIWLQTQQNENTYLRGSDAWLKTAERSFHTRIGIVNKQRFVEEQKLESGVWMGLIGHDTVPHKRALTLAYKADRLIEAEFKRLGIPPTIRQEIKAKVAGQISQNAEEAWGSETEKTAWKNLTGVKVIREMVGNATTLAEMAVPETVAISQGVRLLAEARLDQPTTNLLAVGMGELASRLSEYVRWNRQRVIENTVAVMSLAAISALTPAFVKWLAAFMQR